MITITKSPVTCLFCLSDEHDNHLVEGPHFALAICAACLKDLKAALSPKKKPEPSLTDTERTKLINDFYPMTQAQVNEQIELALSHKSAKNYGNTYLYVRGWLRRDTERKGRPFSGASAVNRDTEAYHHWPNGQVR